MPQPSNNQPKKLTEADVEKALATIADPNLREVCERFGKTIARSELAKDVVEFRELACSTPQEEQQIFSFLPHQMAKVSVFFPMSDREVKEENRQIIKQLVHETGWGRIVVEGIKLAIFEEDILLALLKISKDSFQKDTAGGYYVETSMNEIISMLYGRHGYTKKNEDRIERALQHFQLVRFELTTFDQRKKGNERVKTETVRSIGNIVQSYKYSHRSKKLVVYFNPHFFAYFLEAMLTNLNLTLRRKLKRDGSKALLRFLSTHTSPKRMHICTVLNAINFNVNQPMFRLRSRTRQFINELKKQGVLGPNTKVYSDDTVLFEVLPSSLQLPKK